jgi:hypothetical protein
MSFGSENPELWDEICKCGIVNWIRGRLEREGFDDVDDKTIEAVVAALYEVPKTRDILLDLANDDVCSSEADYWGGKIDEAVMRHESKKGY